MIKNQWNALLLLRLYFRNEDFFMAATDELEDSMNMFHSLQHCTAP